MDTGFANVVFVHNLPVVPPEKFEKLVNVVRKIYSQIGVIPEGEPAPCGARLHAANARRFAQLLPPPRRSCRQQPRAHVCLPYAGGLWMPVDDATKNSKGYAFIEFSSAAEAAAAQEQTDGYKLDKQHVFKARDCAFACAAACAAACLSSGSP